MTTLPKNKVRRRAARGFDTKKTSLGILNILFPSPIFLGIFAGFYTNMNVSIKKNHSAVTLFSPRLPLLFSTFPHTPAAAAPLCAWWLVFFSWLCYNIGCPVLPRLPHTISIFFWSLLKSEKELSTFHGAAFFLLFSVVSRVSVWLYIWQWLLVNILCYFLEKLCHKNMPYLLDLMVGSAVSCFFPVFIKKRKCVLLKLF